VAEEGLIAQPPLPSALYGTTRNFTLLLRVVFATYIGLEAEFV
jgi:hypothetical protein